MVDFGSLEYVVRPPEKYPPIIRRRVLLIVIYCLFGIAVAAVAPLLPSVKVLIPVVIVSAALLFAIIRFSWRHTKPVFEYDVAVGEMTVAKIYGGSLRRRILRLDIKSAELIAPDDGTYRSRLESFNPEKKVVALFGKSDNAYFALFTDRNDKRTVLCFDGNRDLVRLLRKYNPKTVVTFG